MPVCEHDNSKTIRATGMKFEIPGGRHLWLPDQLSTKKGTTFFLKNSPRRQKPPESGFCRKGDLRRDRAHRVKPVLVDSPLAGEVWKHGEGCVNHALQAFLPLQEPTTAVFIVELSNWSDGYRSRLDIQPSVPHHGNSDRFSQMTIGLGME
ncbi:hypothetical protein AVEN_148943-1 [Araneus ventricosus]|uniref:Uncharacterized protein n=1 Tax=Araneus ventricosus TaxID=182803 RepID=A0A4Y2FSK5_ARAVE|nr:hypothetical protein AVEN_148943-1 [Araneus ventricosus]